MRARTIAGVNPIAAQVAHMTGQGRTAKPQVREWQPTPPPSWTPSLAKLSVKTTGRTLDIRNIPIGVEIEMGDFLWEKLAPALQAEGIAVTVSRNRQEDAAWDPYSSWRLGLDGTVSKLDSEGHPLPGVGGEMSSRVMTIREGALDEIRKVFRIMKECGGTGVRMAAFHIHIGARKIGLTAEALANLVKMTLQYEPILYRIAQNGQATHRDDANTERSYADGHRGTVKYCKPLSTENFYQFIHDTDHAEAKQHWYRASSFRNVHPLNGRTYHEGDRFHPSRFKCWNFNGKETIEYRFPNYSDNVEDYIAHVHLALHMVRAAEEQEWELEEVHPWFLEKDLPVREADLHAFLNRTVGEGPVKDHLMRIFVKSGGRTAENPPPADPVKAMMREMAKTLGSRQYRFAIDGTEVTPVEAVEASRTMEAMQRIEGVFPPPFPGVQVYTSRGKGYLANDSRSLKHLLVREMLAVGPREAVGPELQQEQGILAGVQLCERLAKAGTRFFNEAGTEEMAATDGAAPFLALDGHTAIRVILPGESEPIPIARLEELALVDAILRGETAGLTEEQRNMLGAFQELQKQGVKFNRVKITEGGESADLPCAGPAVMMLRFGKDPMTAVLPRKIWWNRPLRSSVKVKSIDTLRELQVKLSQSRFRANLPKFS